MSDHTLIAWGSAPGQLDDIGVTPPTGDTISLAIGLATESQDEGLPPPDSVVPDANGGIVFERLGKDVTEVFHVWDDGSVDYCMFVGARLVERRNL